jgi:RNA polymerase sigma-70 factor (ECF subfamily)
MNPRGPNFLIETATIRQAPQADADAFERIYRLQSRRIYALCLRVAGNLTEAEDLTQEVFFQVSRRFVAISFLNLVAPSGSQRRAHAPAQEKIPGTPLEEMTSRDEESTGPGKEVGGPDLSLIGLIDRVNLEHAVEQLPSIHKIVFVLHDILGYKHREIAKMMGSSVGT